MIGSTYPNSKMEFLIFSYSLSPAFSFLRGLYAAGRRASTDRVFHSIALMPVPPCDLRGRDKAPGLLLCARTDPVHNIHGSSTGGSYFHMTGMFFHNKRRSLHNKQSLSA